MFHSFRIISIISILGMLLGMALMALRIFNTVDFNEALQLVTSGAEWESMYAIWKVINGQQLYTDRLEIPYNAVVYNWLFYHSYAAFSGTILNLLTLGDQWLPTVGRFFSLFAITSGGYGAYCVFTRMYKSINVWTRVYCFAFAGYVAAGPMIGWWTFTARADLWAMALEIIAVAVFLKYYRSRPIAAVLSFSLLCYAAWSFKQINVYAVGAGGLFLLLNRDWKALFTLSGVMIFLWTATLLIGGPLYREAILFSDFTIIFAASQGAFNLSSLATKTTPSLTVLAALLLTYVLLPEKRRTLTGNDGVVLACCGIFVSALMAIPASFQTGAGDNYYFTLSFFMALAVVAGTAALMHDGRLPTLIAPASILGWTIHIIAILMVLGGYKGVTDVRSQHVAHMARKQCLDKLPRPLFVDYSYFSLPWMTPGNEPFVISFQYLVERDAGKTFKQGGIGGLIDERHFNALAFISKATPKTYDGSDLKGYTHRPDLCDAMAVMLKKND